MKKRKLMKKVTSLCLVLSMMGTLPQTFTETLITAEAADEVTDSFKTAVTNLVKLVIVREAAVLMNLYTNGVYEGASSLQPGTYPVQLMVNGTACGALDTVVVTEAQTVYFRVQDGTLIDSVNQADKFHTAAFTGGFDGLSFVNEEKEPYTIANWTPADPNAEFTYLGGGIYKRTFYFNPLEVDTDVQYKAAFDDDWTYSIGAATESGNVEVKIPAGTSELTVYVDEINQVIYDSVRTANFTVTQNDGVVYDFNGLAGQVSIIGSVRSADAWTLEAKGYEFTQITDHLYLYQKQLNAGSYNYKATFDYAKWYEKAGDKSLTVDADGTNVIFLYDAATESLYDSINDQAAVAQLLGMEAAPAVSEVKTNANGTTTFVTVPENAKEVKLVYATRSDAEVGNFTTKAMAMQENGSFAANDIFFGDEAVDLVYYYLVDGVETLDASAATTQVAGKDYSSYTRDVFAGRGVNVPGTFPGASWDAASNGMTYQGNGLYSYTFTAVPAANYEFKISMGTWDENYGVDGVKDGSNYSAVVAEKQDVTVFYNDFSHRAVTSIDYIFADVTLSGAGIPADTKLTDDGLTGIYSAAVALTAGTYSDLNITCGDSTYTIGEFSIDADKTVNFYFDPDSEVYYNDASNVAIDESKIFYNTKDTAYKSVYGAVATDEKVTFTIDTGMDATEVRMIVKGNEKKNLSLEKTTAADGVQKWSVETSFSNIGENSYYFVVSNGSSVKIYGDDDGFYGTGMVTDLTNIKAYDLVVYQSGYETPDWMKNSVIYQIFPDRFFDGDATNDLAQTTSRGATDYEYVSDWYAYPENPEQETLNADSYPAEAFSGDGNWSNEIYGGDLEGITEKVDYLKALGINVIYLNPVFSSISSHRYDTSDYKEIDPVLGDIGDFEELVEVAEENDMHIVLDGVFNHVSDDSIYFDRYYKFLEAGTDRIGAYPYWAYVYDYENAHPTVTEAQAEEAAKKYFKKTYGITDFTYTTWFDFDGKDSVMLNSDGTEVKDTIGKRTDKGVYSYDCWWGYDSMPVVVAKNGSEYQTESWAEEVIGKNETSTTSDGSIAQYWLSEGSNGWRLDVANEVSDETWQHFRKSVKALSSDNVIIGEIWDDATEYLLGDMYDSVMNYVFRDAVLSFAKGGSATDTMNTLEKLRERYPKEAYYAMMNLVASHDTTRVLSYLDGIDDDRKQTDLASAFPTYENTSDLAKQRQYVVALLQMTYPGAPTIYYGDEIGMVGADDPDDRRAFTWGKGNKDIVTWYATLANIRNNYSALRAGDINVFSPVDLDGNSLDNMVGYVRNDSSAVMLVLANNAETASEVSLSATEYGVADGTVVKDLLTGTEYTVEEGKLNVSVAALSGVILATADKAVEISLDEKALSQAYDTAYEVKSTDRAVAATAVELNQTSVTLQKGKTTTLKATVSPANASNALLTWTSSKPAVATVVNGKVKAIANGSTTITATATTGKKATCKVTVKTASTKITLSSTKLTLEKGKTKTLKATMTPKDTTDTVTYTSSNKKVATVDKNGKIKALRAGTTTITAKTTSGKKATCKVTVKISATKVKLNKTKVTLSKGKSVTLKTTVTPKDTTDKLTFTTSNKKVATVTSKGKVTAKKKGTAVITVKTTSGKKATCKITVK